MKSYKNATKRKDIDFFFTINFLMLDVSATCGSVHKLEFVSNWILFNTNISFSKNIE